MKKILMTLLGCLMGVSAMQAIPACPIAQKLMQPDGSSVMLKLKGDEFMSYMTTEDDYTVMKNDSGYYVYAQSVDGELTATSVIAKDEAMRTASDRSFLQSIKTNLRSQKSLLKSAKMRATRDTPSRTKLFNYPKFKGLIILVQFSDQKFGYSNQNEVITNMVNTKNYTGFVDENGVEQDYTGSVRDYYSNNSNGLFEPQFDVYGPVTVNYSVFYPQKVNNMQPLIRAACKQADDEVDFSKYDTDGDGEVDMVYFIFAGYGSNYSGNDSRYVWPHKSEFYRIYGSKTYDGVEMGRYACSTEYYGTPTNHVIDGIGVVCHEFGHVLGLMDLYDTDYEENGQSNDPGSWSIMASGGYFNNSRTPSSYLLYERYALGFANPELITGEGNFSLEPINGSQAGYRINSAVKNEYFLLENRQQTGWDAYLPGHGMIVSRVDSTSVTPWLKNQVNINPKHNYFEILRAGNATTSSNSDPYPGPNGVSMINSSTIPNLNSWTGDKTPLNIKSIAENNAGVVTFSTTEEDAKVKVEDFEDMALTTANATGLQGKFSKWNFTNAIVSDVEGGSRCAAMKKSSLIQSTDPLAVKAEAFQFTVTNSSTVTAAFKFYYSTDNGTKWVSVSNASGDVSVSVAGGATTTLLFPLKLDKSALYRISQVSGSTTKRCYVDDVMVYYEEYLSGVESTIGGKVETFSIVKNGHEITVMSDNAQEPVEVYTVSGQLVSRSSVIDGAVTLELPSTGFYVVRQGSATQKIIM